MTQKLSTKFSKEIAQAEAALTKLLEKNATEREAMGRAETVAQQRIEWLKQQHATALSFES